MTEKEQSKEVRDRLRKSYRHMIPVKKGHATKMMNFYSKNGYLTEKQMAYANKLIDEIKNRAVDPDRDPRNEKRKRDPYTDQEAAYFRRHKSTPDNDTPTPTEGYNSFKEKMNKLLAEEPKSESGEE